MVAEVTEGEVVVAEAEVGAEEGADEEEVAVGLGGTADEVEVGVVEDTEGRRATWTKSTHSRIVSNATSSLTCSIANPALTKIQGQMATLGSHAYDKDVRVVRCKVD